MLLKDSHNKHLLQSQQMLEAVVHRLTFYSLRLHHEVKCYKMKTVII